MHAIILGSGSDIGRELAMRIDADGEWHVTGYRHDEPPVLEPWDLLVCCYGTLEPIGGFWALGDAEWERAFDVNLFLPLRRIKALYPYARRSASVCLFSGAGTGGPALTYSAYSAAKISLVKMVELMDTESMDCKFFIIGPGIVRTKIHDQTLRAKARAANYLSVAKIMSDRKFTFTNHDHIYECLMACHAATKEAVGGRNVYVPGDDWRRLEELAHDPDMFKLRRHGDEALRRGR